jgi:hypothetical protein
MKFEVPLMLTSIEQKFELLAPDAFIPNITKEFEL